MNHYKPTIFIRALPLVALLVTLLSCRPVVDMERPEDYGYGNNRFTNAFVSFWSGMNIHYVFWDLEPAGYWDDMWDTYKPKFNGLDSQTYNTQEKWEEACKKAYRYLIEMASPLKDGHLTIVFDNFPMVITNEIKVDRRFSGIMDNKNPKRAFWSTLSGVPYTEDEAFINYDFLRKTISNYTGSMKIFSTTPNTKQDPLVGFRAALGHIIPSSGGFMLYFYFSGFALSEHTADQHFADILDQYSRDIADPYLKGIIFDLRGNTGGAISDIDLVLNRLIHKPLLSAYTRYKNGPNRLDYKPWAPYYINPYPDPSKRVKNDIPVVALINDYSISCGELTPLAIKAMPQGYLIGTRTYGAQGGRFGSTFPAVTNGGSFANHSGNTIWNNVVQAGLQTKARDGTIYEGMGISPDKTVEFNWTDFYGDGMGSGRDRQLEAAIQHIDPAYSASAP